MPELPEVETIVRELRPQLVGKKLWSIEVKQKSIFYSSVENYQYKIQNKKVLEITRRGKFIVIILEHDLRLIIHLRMTGRLMWKLPVNKEKYLRVIMRFSDASMLYFSDVRKFGRVWLATENDYEQVTGIEKLGKEPMEASFSEQHFIDLFADKQGILKNTLLRQDLLTGVGNIYADEISFRSRLHPRSRIEALSLQDWKNLYEALRYCLAEGIKHNGASVSDFVGTRGTLGKHQEYLQVYGRTGDSCYNCGKAIQKTKVAGRGTFVCIQCQIKK